MPKANLSFSRNTRPVSGLILGIFFLAVFFAASPGSAAPPADEEEPLGWIPDGVWVGAFSGSDAITVEGVYAEASYTGTLNLQVIAREVAGSFEAHGVSSSETAGSYGIATFDATGVVGGTSSEPFMKTSSAVFDFAVTSQGYESNFQTSESSGFSEFPLTMMEIPNCNQISGNFDAASVQSMEQAGANVLHVQTEFTITRVSGIAEMDPEIYQDELLTLLQDADDLVADTIANQSLDADQLWAVVAKADALNTGIIVDLSCTTGNFGNHFNSAIIGIMAKLINLAKAHPEWFTPQQINQIAYAALQVGAIGAGAPNEAQAVELSLALEEVIDNKLAENQKSPSCDDVYALYTVAQLVGSESTLIKTTNAMSQYQCEGL